MKGRGMKRILFSGLIMVMNFLGGGCTLCHYYPGMEGAVFDSHTGKPIKNAAVVGVYDVRKDTRYGESREHVYVTETQTNAEGKFFFRHKLLFTSRIFYSGFSPEPLVYIFSPGYEVFTGDSPLSHFDLMKTTFDKGSYRIKARSMMSITRSGAGKLYTFRLSPLKTFKKRQQNVCYTELDVDPSLIPYYQTLVSNENKAYGQYPWNK